MKCLPTVLILIMVSNGFVMGQIRISKLTVEAGKVFQLKNSDIIVADTIAMEDGAEIQLNSLRKENYIRASVLIAGKKCVINGKGLNGKNGRAGRAGLTFSGPCREGGPGTAGTRGLDGSSGVNLFLYIEKIIVNGNLIIDLSGGNGGDGGDGGTGGSGSSGTRHCRGGNGGAGGNGGEGGTGGNGGSLIISGDEVETIRLMIGSSILVNNSGGVPGYGGLPGSGGSPGIGPSRMNGKTGNEGNEGRDGKAGENGLIQYEQQ